MSVEPGAVTVAIALHEIAQALGAIALSLVLNAILRK